MTAFASGERTIRAGRPADVSDFALSPAQTGFDTGRDR